MAVVAAHGAASPECSPGADIAKLQVRAVKRVSHPPCLAGPQTAEPLAGGRDISATVTPRATAHTKCPPTVEQEGVPDGSIESRADEEL